MFSGTCTAICYRNPIANKQSQNWHWSFQRAPSFVLSWGIRRRKQLTHSNIRTTQDQLHLLSLRQQLTMIDMSVDRRLKPLCWSSKPDRPADDRHLCLTISYGIQCATAGFWNILVLYAWASTYLLRNAELDARIFYYWIHWGIDQKKPQSQLLSACGYFSGNFMWASSDTQ